MIALDKELLMDRCEPREPRCKSRLRAARSGRLSFSRRPGLAREGIAEERLVPQTQADTAGGAIELYLQEIGQVRALSARAERTLAAKAQRGDKHAREQLLKSNLPLVVSIAREYEGIGLSLFELIAEGNLGLIQGLSRFDPAREEKLSTRAAWWIRQAIKRALASFARSRRQA